MIVLIVKSVINLISRFKIIGCGIGVDPGEE